MSLKSLFSKTATTTWSGCAGAPDAEVSADAAGPADPTGAAVDGWSRTGPVVQAAASPAASTTAATDRMVRDMWCPPCLCGGRCPARGGASVRWSVQREPGEAAQPGGEAVPGERGQGAGFEVPGEEAHREVGGHPGGEAAGD